MEVILAMDGGATRTRCVAIDRTGQTLAEAEGSSSNHLREREGAIRTRLAQPLEQTLLLANLRRKDVACLPAGLAGVDYDGYGAEPMFALFRELRLSAA